jgi:hypothetical protein
VITGQQTEVLRGAAEKMRGKRTKPAPEKTFGEETIPIADGINLAVDRSASAIPSPKALVDIALEVRKAFDLLRREDDDD